MPQVGELILIAGVLLTCGLLGSLVATRVPVPGLVLFLAVGMILGDGSGLISFNDFELAQSVGIVALALILFEGGLSAGFPEIRPVLRPALVLAILGTVLTALVTGLVATLLFDFTIQEGLLLASIVGSTDAAAIFALLSSSTLRRRVARTLEAESATNDPVAILLVLGCITWMTEPSFSPLDFVELLVRQFGLGAIAGIAIGRLAVIALRTAQVESGGLNQVATITAVALSFGSADVVGGSGFLAVYLTGLLIGSEPIPGRHMIGAFHEGLAWVAQLSVFLALGLLVNPSELTDVWLEGTALALVLVFVSRPIATYIATLGQGFTAPERVVLGWAGLRGAVPIVLATFPMIAGIPGADLLFNVVFFIVLVSTILQGSTFEWVVRRMGITTSAPALPRPLVDEAAIKGLGAELLTFPVRGDDAIVGLTVRDLGLPRDAVVNVIVREESAIPPRGSTRILPGDDLHVLYRAEASAQLVELTSKWRSGIERRTRPPRPLRGATAVFVLRPWDEADGDQRRPDRVAGHDVVDHLRLRRDAPGCLAVLVDGRYAVCGPIVAIGARRQITRWAHERLTSVGPEERAWLRTVLGAVATDATEQGRLASSPGPQRPAHEGAERRASLRTTS